MASETELLKKIDPPFSQPNSLPQTIMVFRFLKKRTVNWTVFKHWTESGLKFAKNPLILTDKRTNGQYSASISEHTMQKHIGEAYADTKRVEEPEWTISYTEELYLKKPQTSDILERIVACSETREERNDLVDTKGGRQRKERKES